MIRPSVPAHRDVMRATIVLTEHDQTVPALGVQFGERDSLGGLSSFGWTCASLRGHARRSTVTDLLDPLDEGPVMKLNICSIKFLPCFGTSPLCIRFSEAG